MEYHKWITPGLLLVLAVLMFGLFVNVNQLNSAELITGRQSSSFTPSRAEIQEAIAIQLRNKLSTPGILWLTPPLSAGSFNNQADHNRNGTSNGNLTDYVVAVTANVVTDVCLQANQSLRSGSNFIYITNYSFDGGSVNFADITAAGPNVPKLANEVPMVIQPSFVRDDSNIPASGPPGTQHYFRFWLDVSNPAQSPGIYSNRITFQAINNLNSC